MVKKQALVVLVSLVSFIGSAFGLGLGDIKVKSNLNDPLVAEIPLLRLQGLSPGEILPSLASNDDFRRAGIERSFFLSNIQFIVVENELGQPVVQLTTRQAVREPFLNFLVEVNWPSGRLLREYTILLDPPVFDTGLSTGSLVIESTSASQPTQLTTSTVVQSTQQTTQQPAPAVTPRDDVLPAGQYRVQRNDTLWEIALRVPAGSGYSPQQVMLAIQDLNPEAFLGNNINRVKAGSVLQLPTAAQIAVRTRQEAVAEVAAQNRGSAPQLRSPEAAREVQLTATDTAASALPAGDADKNPDGYLELAADSTDGVSASGEPSALVERLRGQLAVAEELNDQYARERDQLQSQVAELQSQLEIMERLVELQSQGMAEVQAAVQVIDEQAQEAVVEPTPAPAVVEQPQPAQPVVVPPAPPVNKDLMWYVTEYTGMAMAWLTASLTNTIIALAAPLLLLLLVFYARSRKNLADESDDSFEHDIETVELTEDFEADLDDDLLAAEESDFDESEVGDELEQIDGVMEAEMYMAYQKFDQAEVKLREAFAEHPSRSDIALKLLEVYAETGNAKAFADTEAKVRFSASEQQQVESFRGRLPLDQVDDDFADFGADNELMEESDVDSTESLGADFDFDLDLDEPELASEEDHSPANTDGFDLTLAESEAEAPVAADDLDFSLDLGDLDDSSADLSSDLDFSMEALESPAETEAETESDLDFSLDFSEELSDSAETSEVPASLDFEEDSAFDLDLEGDADSDNFDLDDLSLDLEPEAEPSSTIAGESEALDADDFTMEFDADDSDLDLNFGSASGSSEQAGSEDDFSIDLHEEEVSVADEDVASDDALQSLADSLDSDADLEEDEFDFLSGNDEASTKLDLARAYIEMEDKDGARDILEEVAQEGSPEQQAQAKELLAQL